MSSSGKLQKLEKEKDKEKMNLTDVGYGTELK